MRIHHACCLLIIALSCSAGPLEDIANMPDLNLVSLWSRSSLVLTPVGLQFYQQLIRQQDIQMILQGVYSQQQGAGGSTDFTIFAPNNDAMSELNRKNEDLNLLWKYHIVPGRYDDQLLFSMAQEKFNLANPRLMTGVRAPNNLPTLAMPFQVR